MQIHSTSLCSLYLWQRLSVVLHMPLRPRKAKDEPLISTECFAPRKCGGCALVCVEISRGLNYFSLFHLLRFPTGLGIKESDTRKTLVSSKKKPTCTLRELPSMRLMHPHMEAKQIHPQLQTLQVRQEVPGSAQLLDMYLLSCALLQPSDYCNFDSFRLFKRWCWWFVRNKTNNRN